MLKRSLMSVVAGAFVELTPGIDDTHTAAPACSAAVAGGRRQGRGRDHLLQVPWPQFHHQLRRQHPRGVGDAIQSMVALPGPERTTIVDYLAKSFPPTDRVAAKIIPGSAQVEIREWQVPTLGSRPHDPLATPDGIDLVDRAVRRTSRAARPEDRPDQGIPADEAAARARTGWSRTRTATSGSPRTRRATSASSIRRPGEVTEYPMPDRARAIRTRRSSTRRARCGSPLQSGNMSAGSIPKTGEMKIVTSPSASDRPVRHRGQLEGRAVVRRLRRQPDRQHRSRRRWRSRNTRCRTRTRGRAASRSRSDDVVWYTDYSRGYLGRFDPKTGKVTEWPSPGGPQSQPYGIAVDEGHRLVQRIGGQAEHARPLRSEDREVPDLGDSLRRRRRPQHDARRKTATS